MFWRKNHTKFKQEKINVLEQRILEFLITNLPSQEALKIQNQIQFFSKLKRIAYKNDIVTELYTDKIGNIPKDYLFERTEEFEFARLEFTIGERKFESKLHMVLGQIFDIAIKPIPPANIEMNIQFKSHRINPELKKNLFGKSDHL